MSQNKRGTYQRKHLALIKLQRGSSYKEKGHLGNLKGEPLIIC